MRMPLRVNIPPLTAIGKRKQIRNPCCRLHQPSGSVRPRRHFGRCKRSSILSLILYRVVLKNHYLINIQTSSVESIEFYEINNEKPRCSIHKLPEIQLPEDLGVPLLLRHIRLCHNGYDAYTRVLYLYMGSPISHFDRLWRAVVTAEGDADTS